MSAPLLVERRGPVALVTLDRPEKRNALSIELRERLRDALHDLADDDGVVSAVLTGAPPAFCSGMDVTEFGGDRAHKARLVEVSVGAFGAVGTFPKPLVAAVNGPAIAGGFALALLCDLRICSSEARMGFSELPRGIPPAYAAARSVLAPAFARELALTGRVIEAREALERGAVTEVVPAEVVLPRALEVAEAIAQHPAAALATKRRILIDREHTAGPLFAEEERALREALLG